MSPSSLAIEIASSVSRYVMIDSTSRIVAGRVLVNTLAHEPAAPFGGFKQSGIGREYGTFGLEAFLEPQAVLTA